MYTLENHTTLPQPVQAFVQWLDAQPAAVQEHIYALLATRQAPPCRPRRRGRPAHGPALIRTNVTLPPAMTAWLHAQPAGVSASIREAVASRMQAAQGDHDD